MDEKLRETALALKKLDEAQCISIMQDGTSNTGAAELGVLAARHEISLINAGFSSIAEWKKSIGIRDSDISKLNKFRLGEVVKDKYSNFVGTIVGIKDDNLSSMSRLEVSRTYETHITGEVSFERVQRVLFD